MALYIGREKLKMSFNDNKSCRLNIPSSVPITNGIRLLSSDNLMLKDLKGLYLTVKESE